MKFLKNKTSYSVFLACLIFCCFGQTGFGYEQLKINISTEPSLLSYNIDTLRILNINETATPIKHPIQVYKPQYGPHDSAYYISAKNIPPFIDEPSIFSFKNFNTNSIVDDDPIRFTIRSYTICNDNTTNHKVIVASGYVHDSAFVVKFVPASDTMTWLYLTTGKDRTGDSTWQPEISHVGTFDYDYDGYLETFFYLNSARDMTPRILYCIEVATLQIEWALPVASLLNYNNFYPCGDSLSPAVIFTTYNPKQGATDAAFSDMYGYLTIVNKQGNIIFNKIIACEYGGTGIIPAEQKGQFYVLHSYPFTDTKQPDTTLPIEYRISKINADGSSIASSTSKFQLCHVWLQPNVDSSYYIYTISSNGIVSRYDTQLNLLAKSEPSKILSYIGTITIPEMTGSVTALGLQNGMIALFDKDFNQVAVFSGYSYIEPVIYNSKRHVVAFLTGAKNGAQMLIISRKDLIDYIKTIFWSYEHYIFIGIIILLTSLIILNHIRQRTQWKLRKTERNLKAFRYATPDLLFYLDDTGIFLDYEGSDKIQLYTHPEEFLGKHIKDVLPKDIAEQALDCIYTALQTNEIQAFTYTLSVPDNEERHYEARIVSVGKHEVLIIVRDFTEQHRAETILATRLRYEAGLASCSQTLLAAPVSADALTEALHHLLEASEVSRVYIFENFDDEHDGLCMRQTHEACSPDVKPEINNPILQHLPYKDGFNRWQQELAKGNAISGIVEDFPQAERDVLEPQNILSILVIPIFISSHWYGFIGFDDTRSKRTWNEDDIRLLRTAAEIIGSFLEILTSNRKLKQERDFTRSILETANSLIVCLDEHARIVVFNRELEQLTGYSREEVLGKRWPELFLLEEDYHEGLKQFREWVLAHPADKYEQKIRTKSGATPIILWSNSSLIDPNTGQLTAIAIGYDITDRKQAIEALRRNEEIIRAQYKGIPIPTYTWQKRGDTFVLVNYNDAAVEITKGGISSYIGKTLEEMNLDKEEIIANDLYQCFTSHKTINREVSYTFSSTNEVKYLSVRYVYIPPDMVMVHSEDITERHQALESLKQSEARYQELFNAVMEGIGVVDAKEVIQFCNPAYARIFEEESPDTMIGKSLFDYIPENQYDIIRTQTDLRKQNISSQYELNIITRKGNKKVLLVSVSPRFDENGQYTGAFGTVIDITERIETEAKLRESEERHRAVWENSPIGICLTDSNNIYRHVNPSYCKLFGYTAEEMLGKSFIDLVIIPGQKEFFETRHKELLGKMERMSQVQVELMTKEKKRIWVEVSTDFIRHDGVGQYMVSMVQDITDRIEADKKIRESELRFRELSNLLPQTIFETDITGFLTFANRVGLEKYMYSHEDIKEGLHVKELFIPEDRERAFASFQKRLAGEEVTNHEYTALRRDGSTFPILVYTSRIMRDNKPVGVRGVVVDMTELKAAEEEIRRSELARYNQIKEIAGGISHEIYNSLYPAIVSLNKLQDYITHGVDKKEQYQKFLRMAKKAVSRAVFMTESITAYSRLDSQKKEEPILLAGLIQEIIDSHAQQVRDLGISVEVLIPKDTTISCSRLHAHSLFNNLIINAIDALKEVEHRSLIIHAITKDNNTQIEISDTGIGIPSDQLHRIFDAFFSTKPQSGTGLGLAMVKRIVDMYNGDIRVRSQLDKGTQFVILFPSAAVDQST